MPKIAYEPKNFRKGTLLTIAIANGIIEEYQAEGMKLTLRQLYYQFVARGKIENNPKQYKRLGVAISDGRLAGHIDWDAIEDRTRNLLGNTNWDGPSDILQATVDSFRMDHWSNQADRIEVWIEKEALIGVIARVCQNLDVDYFACKGYVSQSEMWRTAMRLRGYEDRGQNTTILHLGDHDPSGIDMTRDIEERLRLFGCETSIERLALNWNQVQEYKPPPNPTKLKDSRARDYMAKYGNESWELDALEPKVLRNLITDRVLAARDKSLYNEVLARQAEHRDTLSNVARNWRKL